MSLDHARAYLYRVLPWPPSGDPNAYVNIHWTVPNKKTPGGNDWWNGRACQTIDECIAAVQYAMRSADTKAIYACMSSQRMMEAKQINGPRGAFTINSAIRKQANAVQLRSLFIDIDVKEGNYHDTADAARALAEFCRASGMPRPTLIVKSGTGGMHVYWTLERSLSPMEWQPLADALAEATRRHGLKCDTQCTVDSVRVLRVPGTLNKKITPPGNVELALKSVLPNDYPVEQIRAVLAPYVTKVSNVIPLPPRAAVADVNDELSGGIAERQARPVVLETIIPNCGFIAEAVATGGANFANPLWNMTTLAAIFAEEGRAKAHLMAQGHPSYDPAETDALYDRKLKERDEKNLGWPSCKAIQNAGCTACATCPHLAAGGSPLHFGKSATLPFGATEPDLPASFSRDSDGMVFLATTDADGNSTQIPLADYPLMNAWVQDHPWTLHFDTRLGNTKRVDPISISLETLQGRDWAKTLGRQGFVVSKHQATLLQDFLMSWIKQLQKMKTGVVSSEPYGWAMDGSKLAGFSYGGTTITPLSERPTATADEVLARSYRPQGDLQAWKDAAIMITDQGRPALDLILALSFGAPLMRFTGEKGMIFSAYSSESGIGKSTAIAVAQAVWGHPVKGVQTMDDTLNSVLKKVGELRALPLFWDELKTDEQTSKFVKLAFQITGGVEKSRLTVDTSQRDRGTWQTLLLAASNDSLLDHVIRQTKSTTAGLYRVFEYVVPPTATSSLAQGVVARMVAKLNDNFGGAGLVYARFLGQNFVKVEQEVAKLHDGLSKKVNANREERFWISGMTCAMMGALYANSLGLTAINIKELQKFLITQLGNMRSELSSQPLDVHDAQSINHVVAQYLNAMRARNTLKTNKIHTGAGRPPKGAVEIRGTNLDKLDTIYVQIGEDDGLMRVSSTQFREWLSERGYSSYNTVNAMKAQWGAKVVNGRIGGGTAVASHTTEYLIEVDMAKAGMVPGAN